MINIHIGLFGHSYQAKINSCLRWFIRELLFKFNFQVNIFEEKNFEILEQAHQSIMNTMMVRILEWENLVKIKNNGFAESFEKLNSKASPSFSDIFSRKWLDSSLGD